MQKSVAILLSVSFLAACADGKFIKPNSPNQCGGSGWTLTTVFYGDSHILVIPLSEVKAGSEFRFVLIPQLKGRGATDFSNATVKIRGKRDPEDLWFTEISGTAASGTIFTCVKNTLTTSDIVEYDVEVSFTGEPRPRATLDPRAIVID